MEEDGDEYYYYPRSPFWLPSSSNLRRADLYRRRLSSIFFSLGSLVLLLLIAAILLLFFVISSFIRHYTHNIKPNFVKRNWDKVNLVLVLFALAFGFLSKFRYEDRDQDVYQTTGSSSSNEAPNSNPSTSHPRRPSPPPPSLPQLPATLAPLADKKRTRQAHQGLGRDQEPSDPPSTPPSSSTAAVVQEMDQRIGRKNRKRSGRKANKKFMAYFYIQNKKNRQKHPSVDNLNALFHHPMPPPLPFQFPQSSTPPVPPPPPPPLSDYYNIFTTKKDDHKNIPPTTPATYSYLSPSPPPPPPPTLSDYYNIYTTKKGNRKNIPPTTPATYSYNTPPPPLPPPTVTTASSSRPTIRRVPFTSKKPPMPEKIHNIDDWSSGSEFIPPSPPLPPFKMRDLKYVVEGDYAKLVSTDSSRSGSSDPDEVESDETLSSEASSPLFRPSPDVDTKAGSFIAKVRADMKLEKVNSYNKKQALKMSNLGPNPGSPS